MLECVSGTSGDRSATRTITAVTHWFHRAVSVLPAASASVCECRGHLDAAGDGDDGDPLQNDGITPPRNVSYRHVNPQLAVSPSISCPAVSYA